MVFVSSVLSDLLNNFLLSNECTFEIASSISLTGYLRFNRYFFKSPRRMFKVSSSDTMVFSLLANISSVFRVTGCV